MNVYLDGALVESWDDTARTYTDHRTDPPTTRPYTPEENADADARAAAALRAANEATLRAGLDDVLVRAQTRKTLLLALKGLTNADINANPARHIKDVADELRHASGDIVRLARLAGGLLDSTATD